MPRYLRVESCCAEHCLFYTDYTGERSRDFPEGRDCEKECPSNGDCDNCEEDYCELAARTEPTPIYLTKDEGVKNFKGKSPKECPLGAKKGSRDSMFYFHTSKRKTEAYGFIVIRRITSLYVSISILPGLNVIANTSFFHVRPVRSKKFDSKRYTIYINVEYPEDKGYVAFTGLSDETSNGKKEEINRMYSYLTIF